MFSPKQDSFRRFVLAYRFTDFISHTGCEGTFPT